MKKKKNRNILSYSYSFSIVKEDDISSRIIITRNDIPYCQFFNGVFMNPGGIGSKDDMPPSEKYLVWKHMNYHGDNVIHNKLTLFARDNVFTL